MSSIVFVVTETFNIDGNSEPSIRGIYSILSDAVKAVEDGLNFIDDDGEEPYAGWVDVSPKGTLFKTYSFDEGTISINAYHVDEEGPCQLGWN